MNYDNGLRFDGACRSSSEVPQDCLNYSMVIVPKQTMPYTPLDTCVEPQLQKPHAMNDTNPPPPLPCGNECECPACSEVKGRHFCYKVAWGDSLYTIGNHFGIGWKELCKYNNMKNCQWLYYMDTYLNIPMHP